MLKTTLNIKRKIRKIKEYKDKRRYLQEQLQKEGIYKTITAKNK
jgi:hypothetical protein